MTDDSEAPIRHRRRRPWWQPPSRQVVALAMLLVALFAVLKMRKGCAEGVGGLFKAYDGPLDAGSSPDR